ncbi:MAG TPA: STAS domain-containing protein [Candidatus Elarobacter sp.]|nr:STAS domain-containing protein [Candidatus Elarobacter sp.]
MQPPHAVSFSGDLDIWKEEEVDARLATIDGSAPVLIDLSAVRYLDSAFLSALIRLRRRIPDSPITIVVEVPSVRRIFSITQLDQLFEIVPFRPD